MRLQKIIAAAGIASRRGAEQLIAEGRVTVNGGAAQLGYIAEPQDEIRVDGVLLHATGAKKLYIALHKPAGYITTAHDPQGRPTVLELVADAPARVFPVGRLDYDTSGLLLLTTDGDWAQHISHPRHATPKTYLAKVKGTPSRDALKKLRDGIRIDGIMTAPARATIIAANTLEIVITEGRNRQVRRMCQAIGHPVKALTRTAIGGIGLGKLREGAWRKLTEEEIRGISQLR